MKGLRLEPGKVTVGTTKCPKCELIIPYSKWVSDVCPFGYVLDSGQRVAGAECPIFECESFRYPADHPYNKEPGSKVEKLPEGKNFDEDEA